MKHTFKDWLQATRYWSFPVSTMPIIVTFAFLLSKGAVPSGIAPYINLVLALLGVVVLHSAGNVLSDYFDYKKGVDSEEAFAVPNLVFHKFEPLEYLNFSLLLFVVGILIGLVLVILTGWKLLIIGGIGVVLTAFYSFLKFRALGDADIFVIFSVLTMLGTGCVITGTITAAPLVLALPVGLITVAVLHANNTLDIPTDGKAGIKTFAMLLGARSSCCLYMTYMIIPFAYMVLAVLFGWVSPFALLCLIAAVPAYKNFKQAQTFPQLGVEAMKGLDQATAKLQLVFSGLLAIGLFVAAIVA